MVTRHYGSNMIDAGLSRQPMSQSGCLYSKSNFTALALAANSEVVGLSVPIPSGVINSKSTGIRVRSYWSSAGAGDKTIRYRMTDETGTLLAGPFVFSPASTAALADMELFLTDEASGGWEAYSSAKADLEILGTLRITGTDDIRDDWVLAITIESATASALQLHNVRVDVLREGGVSA